MTIILILLQSSYLRWITLLHFIPPAPVAKCPQQLDEGGITAPPKSGIIHVTNWQGLSAPYACNMLRRRTICTSDPIGVAVAKKLKTHIWNTGAAIVTSV